MTTPKKILIAAGSLVLATLVAVILALLTVIRPLLEAGVRSAVRSAIATEIQGECLVETIRILPTSIRLGHFCCSRELQPGSRAVLSFPYAELSLHPRLVLRRAVNVVRTGAPLDSLLNLSLIESVFLPRGKLMVTRGDSLHFEAHGLDINIACGARPRGTVLGDTAFVRNMVGFRKIDADFELGDSTVMVRRSNARTLDGAISVALVLHTSSGQVRACSVRASGIDLATTYSLLPAAKGTLSGKADIVFHPSPGRWGADSLSGKGRVVVRNMVASGLPIQNTLILALFLPGLSSTSFEEVTADFRIAGGQRITIDSLHGAGEPLEMRLSGWIDAKGGVDQRIEGILSADFAKTLNKVVARSLDTRLDGRRGFACRVRGTVDNPRVELEGGLMRRAISKAFEGMRGELEGMFR